MGQQFEDPRFFHGRISSVNYNCYTQEEKEDGSYGGVASGSFNYGNSNPDLKTRVEADMAAWMEAAPGRKTGGYTVGFADGVRIRAGSSYLGPGSPGAGR